MKIDNSFTVALPPDETWAVLLDVPSIAPCMPGAELLEVQDERTFIGLVKVKLGPVAVAFKGKAHFTEIDEAAHTVKVKAAGQEAKGRGNAAADVVFRLSPDAAGTRVHVSTDVNLAGAVAQYGRAQGVIAGVAQVLIDQFAANLRDHLAATMSAPSVMAVADGAASPPSAARHAAPAKGVSVLALLFAYLRHLFFRKAAR